MPRSVGSLSLCVNNKAASSSGARSFLARIHSIQETCSSPPLNGGIVDVPVEDPALRGSEFIGFVPHSVRNGLSAGWYFF